MSIRSVLQDVSERKAVRKQAGKWGCFVDYYENLAELLRDPSDLTEPTLYAVVQEYKNTVNWIFEKDDIVQSQKDILLNALDYCLVNDYERPAYVLAKMLSVSDLGVEVAGLARKYDHEVIGNIALDTALSNYRFALEVHKEYDHEDSHVLAAGESEFVKKHRKIYENVTGILGVLCSSLFIQE